MITDPVKNKYLIGLGLGMIVGLQAWTHAAKVFLAIAAAFLLLAGVALTFFEDDKANRSWGGIIRWKRNK